jgi:hypothetical protein
MYEKNGPEGPEAPREAKPSRHEWTEDGEAVQSARKIFFKKIKRLVS